MLKKNLKACFLKLCQKIYNPGRTPDLLEIGKNPEEIIEFAKRNRLACYCALEYNLWPELISEYNDYQKKIKEALKIIRKILREEPFIVIKTFSSYPHLTSDLDVIVKDSETARRLSKAISKKKTKLPIEIDINSKISWTDEEEISNQFVWNNIQKYSFDKIDFFIPNSQLDVLIRIAHIPFELVEIRLGELLHIYNQATMIDWQVLENEAKLMKWPKTFKRMTEMLDSLHCSLFGLPFFDKKKKIEFKKNIQFPFQLPYKFLLRAVIEKRAWNKIYGARYIIKDRFLT